MERLALLLVCAWPWFTALGQVVDFGREVQPLLSDRCFKCHGPDEATREADLRLDVREGLFEVVTPGDPGASELVRRLRHHDPDERMPPSDSGRVLSAAEVDRIEQWVAEGAVWEPHWAYRPIVRPTPPAAADAGWEANPIDAFVLARLEAAGLAPSPAASRPTLMRRLSLDLLGLLPTPDEVDAFVADDSPDAYERVVETMLASPHHGERWGRHWLDQARYADSDGYAPDAARVMWPYRDWVIDAINRDVPFDRFTTLQLAGDLLDEATDESRIATAFNRNTMINTEGGAKAEQFRVEAVVDRANTVGQVWLGLTFGCAQCHDHKFDAISQRDYFSLFAFFNHTTDANSRGARVAVVDDARREELAQAEAQLAAARERLAAWDAQNAARDRESPAAPAAEVEWRAVGSAEMHVVGSAVLERQPDGSWLAQGPSPERSDYEVSFAPSGAVTAVRLEVLADPSLPGGGPGRAGNGNFVLTAIELEAAGEPVGWQSAHADHSQVDYPVVAAIDGEDSTGWAINVSGDSGEQLNVDRTAWFVCEQAVDAGTELTVRLRHRRNPHYQVGRFRLSTTAADPRALAAFLDTGVVEGLERRRLARAAADAGRRLKSVRKRVPRVMVMEELGEPRTTNLLVRGDYLRPGDEVQPGTPFWLPPMQVDDGKRASRLDLARWLVDSRNPLTARVTVNRAWTRYFGQGLVRTENNFGTQGSRPSHPELLDWLAAEFMARGWSMKELHRLIVTSATYRQSSVGSERLAERDPRNDLLARQRRLRVEAEVIRDLALSASHALDPRIGGPSVFPEQPEGVYDFTQVKKDWVTSTGGDRYRRGMYTFFYRSAPYPMLSTFDMPNMVTSCTRRVRSNTPLQALSVANDPVMLDLSAKMAADLLGAPYDGDHNRLVAAFRRCLSRAPTEEELRILRSFLEEERERVTHRAEPLPETAAWAAVCRVLFNTDEFVTRE